MFSRKITRGKLLEFFAAQPACLVAMEACGDAHHWARELTRLGHKVRLIPPAYVKPFVKRHKNDAVDAEAICEAVQRPGMRFMAVKTEAQQAAAIVFRTRDLLVRQRTATAIIALVPAVETFSKGRDFSAWLGLTPLQSSRQQDGAHGLGAADPARGLKGSGRGHGVSHAACQRRRRSRIDQRDEQNDRCRSSTLPFWRSRLRSPIRGPSWLSNLVMSPASVVSSSRARIPRLLRSGIARSSALR